MLENVHTEHKETVLPTSKRKGRKPIEHLKGLLSFLFLLLFTFIFFFFSCLLRSIWIGVPHHGGPDEI